MEHKKRILVVEDEIPMLLALSDKLEGAGFEVLQAKNGEEGVVTALTEHPDLIIMDIVMPKMDGIDASKKIRDDIWGKTAKIMILSNVSDNEKTALAMEHEVFNYLIKAETRLEDIVEKVRELCA